MLWEVGLWLYFHIICWSKKPSLYLVDTGFVMLRKNMESWHFVALSKPFLTKKKYGAICSAHMYNTTVTRQSAVLTFQWRSAVQWTMPTASSVWFSASVPKLLVQVFFLPVIHKDSWIEYITHCVSVRRWEQMAAFLCAAVSQHIIWQVDVSNLKHTSMSSLLPHAHEWAHTHTHYTYIIIIIIKTLYFLHFFFSDTFNTAPYII